MVIYDDAELCGTGNSSASYGIQICDCKDFVVENIDFKAIRLVECGRENIKLTTPDDLAFAKAILSARKDRQS